MTQIYDQFSLSLVGQLVNRNRNKDIGSQETGYYFDIDPLFSFIFMANKKTFRSIDCLIINYIDNDATESIYFISGFINYKKK